MTINKTFHTFIFWCQNIVVKIITKALGEKFYKQKAVVKVRVANFVTNMLTIFFVFCFFGWMTFLKKKISMAGSCRSLCSNCKSH